MPYPFVSASCCRSVVAVAALALASGCLVSTPHDPNAGAKGVATFGDDAAGLLPIAVGATAHIGMTTPHVVARVESSDPARLATGNPSHPNSDIDSHVVNASFDATGAAAGSATVALYDDANVEIDHTTVVVAPVASLAVAADTSAALTVVAGSEIEVHVTMLGAQGETLVGHGAVQFGYEGSVQQAARVDEYCRGECTVFDVAREGEGRVQMTAGSATASIALTAIPPSSVDSLTFSQETVDFTGVAVFDRHARITYSLFARGQLVRGQAIKCVSDDPNVVDADVEVQDDPLDGQVTGSLYVTGTILPGTFKVRCTFGTVKASFTGIVPTVTPTKG